MGDKHSTVPLGLLETGYIYFFAQESGRWGGDTKTCVASIGKLNQNLYDRSALISSAN